MARSRQKWERGFYGLRGFYGFIGGNWHKIGENPRSYPVLLFPIFRGF